MTPLMGFTLGWAAGIVLAAGLDWPAWVWPAASGGLALAFGLLLALGRQAGAGATLRWFGWPGWRPALLAALALAAGAWRWQAAQPDWGDPSFVSAHNGAGTVWLEGLVADEPDVRDARALLRLQVETLQTGAAGPARAAHGLVLVSAPRFSEERLAAAGSAEWRYGDRLRVIGVLESPPEAEDFSYRDYLARLGIHSQINDAGVEFLAERQGQAALQSIFDLKARALAVLARIFPARDAALLSGVLLGVDSAMPPEIKDAFARTGTSHIVAISGFNIAILVSAFMGLFSRLLPANRAAVLTVLVIAGYTVLVGAGASVVRAALMGGLGVAAHRLGRAPGGLHGLAFAALLMTAAQPLTLWDPGFQLSAGATLGLVVYGDRFQGACERLLARRLSAESARRGAELAAELVLLTLAAQVTTLPILLYSFRQLSLITLAANFMVLPVQPAVMILGGLALLLGLAWPPAGQLAAWAVWPLTGYTLALVQFFSQVPAAAIPLGEVAPAAVAAYYAALAAATWLMARPAAERPAWWTDFVRESGPLAGVGALASAGLLAWSVALSWPDQSGLLRISVLDTGPDPVVLIQTPAGGAVLVNGGPSGIALTRGLDRQLPLFSSRLDVLALAGTDAPALGGVPDALERFVVGRVVVTGAAGRGSAYRAVMAALAGQGARPVGAAIRPGFELGDGVTLSVLADGPRGSSLWLERGAFSLAMPFGVARPAEAQSLAAAGPPAATVLVIGERRAGAAEALVEAWDPAVVMVASGVPGLAPAGPDPLAGRTVLRSGDRGALTVTTDGGQFWVETER